MDRLDWLSAIATGLGQGKELQQERQLTEQTRQDALRQQAVENALNKQKYELLLAEHEYEKESDRLKLDAEKAKTQAQFDAWRASIESLLPPELQTGTQQVGTYQPSAFLPKEQPAIQLGAGVPGARQQLFAGTAMGGPEMEQVALGPAQPIMAPTTKPVSEMTIAELEQKVAELDLGKIGITSEGAKTLTPYSRQEQLQHVVQTQTDVAKAASAEATAQVDIATVETTIAEKKANAEKAGYTATGALYDNIIAELQRIPEAQTKGKEVQIKLKFLTDYADSLYVAQVKALRAGIAADDKVILTELAAKEFAASHNGMRPEVYAMTFGLDIRLDQLGISQAYLGLAAAAGVRAEATAGRAGQPTPITRLGNASRISENTVADYLAGLIPKAGAVAAVRAAFKGVSGDPAPYITRIEKGTPKLAAGNNPFDLGAAFMGQ